MSGALHLVLLRGVVPDWIVPAGSSTTGRQAAAHLEGLAALAKGRGLEPLEAYLVDHRAAIEEALRAADWKAPELPAEWGEAIPLDAPPVEDPAYVAAQDAYDVILAEAEMGLMYFPAVDVLKTVAGLIEALEQDPAAAEGMPGVLGDLVTFRYELGHAIHIKIRVHFEVAASEELGVDLAG